MNTVIDANKETCENIDVISIVKITENIKILKTVMDAEEETCENDYNDDIGELACGLWQRWQQRPGPRRVDPCSRCTVYALPLSFLAIISLFAKFIIKSLLGSL